MALYFGENKFDGDFEARGGFGSSEHGASGTIYRKRMGEGEGYKTLRVYNREGWSFNPQVSRQNDQSFATDSNSLPKLRAITLSRPFLSICRKSHRHSHFAIKCISDHLYSGSLYSLKKNTGNQGNLFSETNCLFK